MVCLDCYDSGLCLIRWLGLGNVVGNKPWQSRLGSILAVNVLMDSLVWHSIDAVRPDLGTGMVAILAEEQRTAVRQELNGRRFRQRFGSGPALVNKSINTSIETR